MLRKVNSIRVTKGVNKDRIYFQHTEKKNVICHYNFRIFTTKNSNESYFVTLSESSVYGFEKPIFLISIVEGVNREYTVTDKLLHHV